MKVKRFAFSLVTLLVFPLLSCSTTGTSSKDYGDNNSSIEGLFVIQEENDLNSSNLKGNVAFAFPQDLLSSNSVVRSFANNVYQSGKLVYVYGESVTLSSFNSLVLNGNNENVDTNYYSDGKGLALKFPTIGSKDVFNVVSGFNYAKEIKNWSACIAFLNLDTDSSTYIKMIENDYKNQTAAETKTVLRSFETVRSNTTNIYSYDVSDFSNYVVAGFYLYQDIGERDPEQNYFGVSTTVTPRSADGSSSANEVYVQYNLINSNAILSDYAPDNSDYTLDVGTSVGTSGVDLSFSTTVHSKPSITSKFYPDMNSAAIQWNQGISPLNDTGLKSGVSWHCNTINPQVDVIFYGYFNSHRTSLKSFTVSSIVEDIQ